MIVTIPELIAYILGVTAAWVVIALVIGFLTWLASIPATWGMCFAAAAVWMIVARFIRRTFSR